jgi:hypothetical protein
MNKVEQAGFVLVVLLWHFWSGVVVVVVVVVVDLKNI